MSELRKQRCLYSPWTAEMFLSMFDEMFLSLFDEMFLSLFDEMLLSLFDRRDLKLTSYSSLQSGMTIAFSTPLVSSSRCSSRTGSVSLPARRARTHCCLPRSLPQLSSQSLLLNSRLSVQSSQLSFAHDAETLHHAITPQPCALRVVMKELEAVMPQRRVEHVTYRVPVGSCVHLGGFARLDNVGGEPYFFTIFVGNQVRPLYRFPTDVVAERGIVAHPFV